MTRLIRESRRCKFARPPATLLQTGIICLRTGQGLYSHPSPCLVGEELSWTLATWTPPVQETLLPQYNLMGSNGLSCNYMLTPSQSNPSPESAVSGLRCSFCEDRAACARRGWHRVSILKTNCDPGKEAYCMDCGDKGSLPWGRAELRKQGDFLETLANAIIEQGDKEL